MTRSSQMIESLPNPERFIPVMVAAERVHSGAHYPSDMAAGGATGLAAAALIRDAPHLLRRRVPDGR